MLAHCRQIPLSHSLGSIRIQAPLELVWHAPGWPFTTWYVRRTLPAEEPADAAGSQPFLTLSAASTMYGYLGEVTFVTIEKDVDQLRHVR